MVDIQHLNVKKNQWKTLPNRQNFTLCKKIGGEKSNDDVRNFTASS